MGENNKEYFMKLNNASTDWLCPNTDSLEAGERNIWAALIIGAICEAIGEFRSSAGVTDLTRRSMHSKQARRWIENDEVYCCEDKGISFAFACQGLELDKDHFRKLIDPSSKARALEFIDNYTRQKL